MKAGLFKGPYINKLNEALVRKSLPYKPVGEASTDIRCLGHRHDESCMSYLVYKHNLPLDAGTHFQPFDSQRDYINSDIYIVNQGM
jgi:hypothetical protein